VETSSLQLSRDSKGGFNAEFEVLRRKETNAPRVLIRSKSIVIEHLDDRVAKVDWSEITVGRYRAVLQSLQGKSELASILVSVSLGDLKLGDVGLPLSIVDNPEVLWK